MKNLRKVLAFTLALAMLLSTMTFTTFAASKEVEALANLKLLLNTTDAEVEQELTRSVGLAMVLKALGYAQADADAKAADNKFVDMDDAAWAKGYAALAEELKISNGTSVEPKLFSPMQKLDQKSFVTFMLRALGYDADKAWAEAGALAKEAGLVAGELAEGAFKKGDAAVVMYNALLAKVQGDEKGRTLAEKLVDEKKLDKDLAVANGLMSAEPENLEVVSVMADNLREVTVMFNGSVDKDTAEKASNYKVKSKNVKRAKLMEDGKTVVLGLAGFESLENKKETKLTVTGVKNAAGVVMTKQEIAFTPSDTEIPTVKDVVFTGPKSLEITFSEPILYAGKVVLKNGKTTLTGRTSVKESDERVVSVELFTTLKDGAEYVVAVGNPKNNNDYVLDYAKYSNIYFEGTYQYNADKTAPEAKVVKADQKTVVVEFNKPVKGITKDHFYHSVAAYKARAVFKDEEMKKPVLKNESVSKVWVSFYDDANKKANTNFPLPAGDVQFVVLGENASKVKIEDNWKNPLAATTLIVTVSADREAPEVVTAEVTGEKEIKVTFNEKISNLDRDRFTLLDKDGKEVQKGSKMKVTAEDGDKVAVLKLADSYAGKTLTLNIKGLKDASLYENMMADYTTSLEFVDKTWKGVKSAEFRMFNIESGNTPSSTPANPEEYRYQIIVTFEEDMDDSATDVANYKLMRGDKTHNIQGTADFFEGKNNIVLFELSRDKDTAKDTDAKFVSGNGPDMLTGTLELVVSDRVKDLAGNKNGSFQTKVEVKPFSMGAKPKIEKAEVVETKKVVVKLDKEIVNLDPSRFEVKKLIPAVGTTPARYEVYTVDATYATPDNKTIEIYLADTKALGTGNGTANFGDVKLYFTQPQYSQDYLVDIYNRPLENVDGMALTDKVAPAVAAFKYVDGGAMTATGAAWNNAEGKTGLESLDGKPIIKVDAAYSEIGFNASTDDREVTVTATVMIKYTEPIAGLTLSTTTYTLDNGFKVSSTPGAVADVVTVTATKKIKTKKAFDDFKSEVEDMLNDLTITQVGSIKDGNDNVMAGNSNAMEILDVK